MIILARKLWHTALPEPRTSIENWPTVLFSWWCTSFAAVIIITRLWGRLVRSSKFFREDYMMMIALVPLFLRMACVHFVLVYGTTNVDLTHHIYTDEQLYYRTIGARLVLPARIFYVMFIWVSKLTISEFLKRITIRIWRRSYEISLQSIRVLLFLTFGAVVITTLAECQPLEQYWQFTSGPEANCRQGFAQLFVMGMCDIVTDILLIAFPIPIILSSGQGWKRKVEMISLFGLSALMIGLTATRIPEVIRKHSRQQYRTLWASCEVLASAAVSNAIILCSFLRDQGTKKNKFRQYSDAERMDRVGGGRRPTLARQQLHESEEDLFFALGCRVPEHLRKDDATSSHATFSTHTRVDTPVAVRHPPEGQGTWFHERDDEE